jgi:autotransporter translocation and assembly factor TamB
LKIVQKAIILNGEIILNSGNVSGPKTAIINLQKSKILFDGDSKNPALNIRGDSTVNGINIDIMLTGMLDKPDIVFKSVPPMPEERLMLMVATGKGWTGAEDALNKGKISPDLAKDFVSYFLFSDPGNGMGEKFRLDNFSIKYDDKTQGASVKKDITDKTLLSCGVEQPKETGKEKEITRKIGVEQKLTENISVSGKRELTQGSKADGKDTKPNDEVVVKYKAAF